MPITLPGSPCLQNMERVCPSRHRIMNAAFPTTAGAWQGNSLDPDVKPDQRSPLQDASPSRIRLRHRCRGPRSPTMAQRRPQADPFATSSQPTTSNVRASTSSASLRRGDFADGEIESRSESPIAIFGSQRIERARQSAGSVRSAQYGPAQPHVPVAGGEDGVGVDQRGWRFASQEEAQDLIFDQQVTRWRGRDHRSPLVPAAGRHLSRRRTAVDVAPSRRPEQA